MAEEVKVLEFNDVIDYLGKYENFIVTLVTIKWGESYSEGILFYNEELNILTVDKTIEEEFGNIIEYHPQYGKQMLELRTKLVPYNEMVNRIDDFNPDIYFKDAIDNNQVSDGEVVKDSDIKTDI